MQKKLFLFFFLVILSIHATAYTIEGNSVFMEDEQASLRVTPHTAQSLTNNFKQEFTLCNKTETGRIIYSAYVFNQKLESGKIEHFLNPAYDWVEYEKNCAYDFNYVLNEDSDQNPHRAWCFETIDMNGTDGNLVYWEQEFKTGSLETATIQWDINELVFGNEWIDITNSYQNNYRELNEKHFYPNIQGTVFAPNTCKTWRIEYSPKENDSTKKWDLWLWTDIWGWSCILTDSCQKTLKLDPWWDAGGDWLYKQQITAKTSEVLTSDVTNDHAILVDINSSNTDFWDNVNADGNDVRFINSSEDGEFDYHFEDFNHTTDSMIAWVEITDTFTSAGNTEFYLYYGNSEAVDDQDEAGTYPSAVTSVLHMDGGGTATNEDGTGNYDFTNNSGPSDTTGKIGQATQYVRTSSQNSTNATLGDVEQTKNSTSFWFAMADNIPNAAGQRLLIKINDGSNYAWNYTFYSDEGRFHTMKYGAAVYTALYSVKNTWNQNEWYHIVVTYDSTIGAGSDTHMLYINGVESASSVTNGTFSTIAAGTESDAFMGSSNASDYYSSVSIDETKYFINVSLTSDEAKLIYNSEGNKGFLEFGEQESNTPADSCTCPTTGHWEITNGDTCTLTDECNLTGGDLHIVDGSLNITATGTLTIPSGQKIVIDYDNNFFIEKLAKIVIRK